MTKLKKALLTAGVTAGAYFSTVTTALAQVGTVDVPQGYATDIGVILSSLLSFVMIIAAILVFLYLIWGGIEWITSGGDKGKTESARNKITSAIIGLIVLAASYAILQLALSLLGFTDGIDEVFRNIKPITGKTTIESE